MSKGIIGDGVASRSGWSLNWQYDSTISSNTTLTADRVVRNLTIKDGAIVSVDGYRIIVKGLLTLTGGGRITANGVAGSTGASGGAGGTSPIGRTIGGGWPGGAGTATAGNTAAFSAGITMGGLGGSGGSGTSGAGGSESTPSFDEDVYGGRIQESLAAYARVYDTAGAFIRVRGGGGGAGGGGGGGNFGGGGGGGGGVVLIEANEILIQGVNSGIFANGGPGGGASANAGGGGGGGGGVVFIKTNGIFMLGGSPTSGIFTLGNVAGVGGNTSGVAGSPGEIFIYTGRTVYTGNYEMPADYFTETL